MKKILSILLVLMMLFSVTAFAESGPGGTPPGDPPSGETGTAPGDGSGFGGGTPPGGSTSSFEYTAAAEIIEAAEQAGQTYTSDIYADDGYLFLLWDFKDADVPQIHVRTWQPRILDDQTVIPENEIFSLRNFNLK